MTRRSSTLWPRLLTAILVVAGLAGGAWMTLRRPPPAPAPTWPAIQRSLQRRDWGEADRLLTRWLEAHPGHAEGLLNLAQLRQDSGRREEAVRLLGEVPQRDPAWARAQAMLGELAIEDRRAADAERHLRAAAGRDRNALAPRQRLLYLMGMEQRTAEVRELLWEMKEILADPMVLVDLALELVVDLRDVRNFPPELEQFVARTPDDPFLRRAWGMALLFRGDSRGAVPHLTAAADRLTNDPTGRFALAECRILQGQSIDVDEVMGPTPADRSGAATWWVHRGRLKESLGDPKGAAESFREAIRSQPDRREAHLRLGHVLERLGAKDEAKDRLQQAARLGERFASARREFRQVKSSGLPRDAALYQRLGTLCGDVGLEREARAWFELALALDPTLEIARKALASAAPEDDSPPVALARPLLRAGEAGAGRLAKEDRIGPVATESGIAFEDIAASAGINYAYDSGASERHFIAETMGGGVGLIDHDGDGWLDVYFVNGCPLDFDPRHPPTPNRLFRNRGDGTFEDVTARAGVAGEGYGMGCTVGDFDNDGHDDLLVTGLERTILYRNRGDGSFEDVTRRAGVLAEGWSTAAGFGDLDGDGDLDLVVVRYLDLKRDDPTRCRDASGRPMHCPPARFSAQSDLLYRNNGDGTFTEVGKSAGFEGPGGRGLGLALVDLDDDGKLDLFVANDSSPDFLFRNLGGLRFQELGVAAGVATNGSGQTTASMGVVAEDLDGDGQPDLFVTNLINESSTFFRNLGSWLFQDATLGAGLDAPSRGKTGFGDAALDADNDGVLDLFVANGEVDDRPWINSPMAQNPLFFRGSGGGRFEVVKSPARFPYLEGKGVGRGVAAGDLDNDGRVDLIVVHRDGPAAMLRNRSEGGNWLSVRLVGTRSSRTAIGARVTCRVGNRSITRHLSGGTGYLSSHDPRLFFGLEKSTRVDRLEVRWPSGLVQSWTDLEANRHLWLREGESEPVDSTKKGRPGK